MIHCALQAGLLCYTAPEDVQSAVVCGKLLSVRTADEEPRRAVGGRIRSLSFSRRKGKSSESVLLAFQTDQRLYELRVDSQAEAGAWREACGRTISAATTKHSGSL